MAIELFFMICLGILIYKSIKCILHSLRISNCLDRHVLITGCDSGFGHLLVKRLEKLGFHVFACCLTERALEEFRLHNTSKVIPLHQVTNDKSVHACLEKVRRNLGDVGALQFKFSIKCYSSAFHFVFNIDHFRSTVLGRVLGHH